LDACPEMRSGPAGDHDVAALDSHLLQVLRVQQVVKGQNQNAGSASFGNGHCLTCLMMARGSKSNQKESMSSQAFSSFSLSVACHGGDVRGYCAFARGGRAGRTRWAREMRSRPQTRSSICATSISRSWATVGAALVPSPWYAAAEKKRPAVR